MKKKIVKKLLTSTLALCMMTSMLAGCGNNSENTTGGTEQAAEESKITETTQGTAESEAAEEAVDDLSEKVTLDLLVLYQEGEKDWNDYYFVKKIEEKFNVDLQIEMIENTVWNEKIALRFASKDLPDFIINNVSYAVDSVLYGEQGFLADLSDYISEETTPNILKMWEEVPASKVSVTSEDGSIYTIKGVDNEISALDGCRFYINGEWAEKILGKLPETTEEFYEYLKGVKAQDMNGDGDPDNEIPLGAYYKHSSGISVMSMLRAAFGLLDKEWQVMDDGQVMSVVMSDNYKEMLKYMNKLYVEGLMDQEFFTQTSDQFKAKDSQYLYGAYGNWTPEWNKPAEDVEAGKYKMYVGMPVLTSPVNDTKMWPAKDVKLQGQFTVMSGCENVERVVMIADWLFSEEGFMALTAGPQYGEDDNYPEWGYTGGKEDYVIVNEDGESETFPEEYNDYFAFVYGERTPHFGAVPYYRNWVQQQEEGTGDSWLTQCTAGTHAEYYKTGYPTAVALSQDESDEYSLLMTDISSYVSEMESKMILGELDIDATWNTYLEGLRSRGIEDALKIKQDAYDRYVKMLE